MKLDGIRVLDLSRFLPGPLLTQMMADQGAEVLKIEAVCGGEPTRKAGGMREGVSVFFANTNRGKKSVALDLKSPMGVEAVLRLAETCDVIVETFRPGVADRLGVGYRMVAERAPRIVYASISSFGQNGPYRDIASHDLTIEAACGALSITRGRDGAPAIPGVPAADILSATTALSGILMALFRRQKTGQGDFLDIAMADCLLAALPNNFDAAMAEGRQPDPMLSRSLGGNALYSIYAAKDGGWMAIGSQEHKFAVNILTALGRVDLIEVSKRPPGPDQNPLRDFLSETFANLTMQEWEAFFATSDVPIAPVRSLPEVLEDLHFRSRGMVLEDSNGWHHLGSPIHFLLEPGAPVLQLPALGQHSRTVLREIGFTENEIDEAILDGVTHEASPDEIVAHSGS
jgi:crotonobetainyl-CoA:carnitine CoA-transferase CaiB-like acyl-CoA transferase